MTTRSPRISRSPSPVGPMLLGTAAVTFFALNRATSPDVYREVVATVAGWPEWAHRLVELASEAGLVVLAAVLAAVGWRARSRGERAIAAALLGAIGTVLAYLASELLKLVVTQERPCRELAVQALVECPAPGDWSLPSNHATLAAALAAAVVLVAPRLWASVTALALLVAASRVALGVHYPHDVVDGLLLGGVLVTVVGLALLRPGTHLVRALAGRPVLGRLLLASPRVPATGAGYGDRHGA